jgi:hypothetical protein
MRTFNLCLLIMTFLLTELSPSWGATNCAATQELPSISWNPKVQHHVHKSPPLIHILSHSNPIHITHAIYLRSILYCPSTYVLVFLPVVSFLLAFPPIPYMHSSSSPFVLYAPPISFFLTWSFELYLEKSTSYEAINKDQLYLISHSR